MDFRSALLVLKRGKTKFRAPPKKPRNFVRFNRAVGPIKLV